MRPAELTLVDAGLRCSCNAQLPILVEELPRPGIYICYSCTKRFKIVVTKEGEDELQDT